MKKLLLTFVVSTVLMCMLAIGISAIDVNGIDYTFSGTEATVSSANQDIKTENVVIPATVTSEGTTYTVTKIGSEAFYGNTTIKTLTFENINNIVSIGGSAFRDCTSLTGTYNFSELTSIGWNAFRNSATAEDSYLVLTLPKIQTIGGNGGDTHVFSYSGLREIYIGNTINAINLNSFTSCTKLWKIEIQNGVKDTFSFASYTFVDCTALKAFSIPEGVKTLPHRMFKGCTSLTAVYLPSTLTSIDSGSGEHSTFYNCKNMYFVSEPFTFTADDDIPVKEDVYYFPSSLTSLSEETFKLCQSLNKTLVFPVGITSVSNAWAFEAGISNPTLENIVFLGDMDTISTNSWKLTGKIYFANANDKSSADFSSYSNSKSTVFCNAEDNTTHLAEKTVDVEASCEVDAGTYTYCFCGEVISKVVKEGTALPHNYDYVNGKATLISISYTDYSADGTKIVVCANCGESAERVASSLFTNQGFSTQESDGDSIVICYLVNKEAITEYQNVTGKTVEYGVFAVLKSNLMDGENVVLDPLSANGVIKADLTDYGFEAFNLKITGFNTDEQKSAEIVLGAYVTVSDKTYYMQDDKNSTKGTNDSYYYTSYNMMFQTATEAN